MLLTIGLLYIPLHMFGYRVWGAPRLFDNVVLSTPIEIVELTEDGGVILRDGRILKLQGIESLPCLYDDGAMGRLLRLSRDGTKIMGELTSIEADGVRISVECRRYGWCGATFTQRLLPGTVPRYRVMDLAEFLINGHWALGNPGGVHLASLEGERKKQELAAQVQGMGCWSHREYLCANVDQDEMFKDLCGPSFTFLRGNWGCSHDRASILLRCDYPGIRQFLLERIRDEETRIYSRTSLARELAIAGDLSGVDFLVDSIICPSREEFAESARGEAYLSTVVTDLQQMFGLQRSWTVKELDAECQRTCTWYREFRPTLRWDEKLRRLVCE